MAKINRYAGNLRPFAADALDFERTVFGSETEADDLDSNITSDFFRGWGIVGVNENPTKQDFNGFAYTVSQLIAYLHQVGISEWDDEQEFSEHGFCIGSDGRLYQSLVAENIGNDPTTDGGTNWLDVFTAANIDYDNSDSGLTATDTKAALDELKNAVNIDYDNTDSGLSATNVKTALDEVGSAALLASAPAYYERSRPWKVKDRTTNRYIIVSPDYLMVNIDRNGYVLTSAVEIDVTATTSWDDTTVMDWTVAANRAGKDFYIYAVQPSSGNAPEFILSANATVPDGYTADNSRKIGGFHTLCADVGTISGHDLSGYVAGDILPQSVWCLNHRPESEPEGMVYDPGTGKWVDIYLVSVQSGDLASVNGATTADGASAEAFHWYKFDQWFRRIRKRFPFQGEFVALSIGSNQGTNISGSADPGTTGGHVDTAGRRMISNIGCEDCCGALWQWGIEGAATNDVGSSWSNAFDGNDSDVGGQHYEAPNRPLFGGNWNDGSKCGSRGSAWSLSPLNLYSSGGARGVAESLKRGQ